MGYNYQKECQSKASVDVRSTIGLPDDFKIKIRTYYIRFYQSEENNIFFYCSLAVPSIADEEGYTLEYQFISLPEENDNSDETKFDSKFHAAAYASEYELEEDHTPSIEHYIYSAPNNGKSFDELSDSLIIRYESKTACGSTELLLHMTIKNTAYSAYVLLDDNVCELIR